MIRQEFEELAGYRVSQETYDTVIEPMYLATSLLKEAFVKVVDFRNYGEIAFRELLNSLRKNAVYLKSVSSEDINAPTMEKIAHIMDSIDECMSEHYGGKTLKLEWAVNEAGKPYPSVLYVNDDYYNLVVF